MEDWYILLWGRSYRLPLGELYPFVEGFPQHWNISPDENVGGRAIFHQNVLPAMSQALGFRSEAPATALLSADCGHQVPATVRSLGSCPESWGQSDTWPVLAQSTVPVPSGLSRALPGCSSTVCLT